MSPCSCTPPMLRRSSFSSCCPSGDTDAATRRRLPRRQRRRPRGRRGFGHELRKRPSGTRAVRGAVDHPAALRGAGPARDRVLLRGLGPRPHRPTALHLALMALIVVALWVGDHALVARPTSRQEVLLDCGFTDGVELRAHLTELFGRRRSRRPPTRAGGRRDRLPRRERIVALPACCWAWCR